MRRGRDLGRGDGLEGLLHRLHHFDRARQCFARRLASRRGRSIHRAQQHLFAATAAGQAIRRRLRPGRYRARHAAAERPRAAKFPCRRRGTVRTAQTTTGFGENLMACVMPWNWRMARSTSSHSSSCTLISSSMRFAPTEKFAASLVMTNASKSSPGPPGFSVCVIRLMMSAPSEFILLNGTRCSPRRRRDPPATRRNSSSPRRSISSRP